MKSFFVFVLLLLITACSSVKVGDREIVQTSGDKPEWASESKVFDRTDSQLYFNDLKLDREHLDIARDEVESSLRLDVAERLSTEISGQVWNAYAGKNRQGGMIESEVSAAVKNSANKITIIGFSLTDFYWEKIRVQEEYGAGYLYDVYGRGSISLSEYNRLFKQALQKFAGNSKGDLKEAANEVLNSL